MPCASACAARPAATHDRPIPLPAKPTYASSTISPCFPIAFVSRPYVSLSHAFHASCNCSNDPSTISVSSRPRGRGALAGPPRPAAAAQSSSPDGLSASLTSRPYLDPPSRARCALCLYFQKAPLARPLCIVPFFALPQYASVSPAPLLASRPARCVHSLRLHSRCTLNAHHAPRICSSTRIALHPTVF